MRVRAEPHFWSVPQPSGVLQDPGWPDSAPAGLSSGRVTYLIDTYSFTSAA